MPDGEIVLEISGGVATATINRPDKRNALNASALGELHAAVEAVARDPSARVLVLTGAGDKAFCSGADLGRMFGSDDAPRPEGAVVGAHQARGQLARLFTSLYGLGKPTIAKVRGYALAGGFGLALACDMVVASRDAIFGTPEIEVGLWPYMVTVPMLRSMPSKVALELMMTGRRVPAEEALGLGFVNRVVDPQDLDAVTAEIAEVLAAKSPQAMKLGRTAFYRALSMGTEEALEYLLAMLTVTSSTEDAAEGIAAFMEKRPPSWVGH
jgi:enoyl-CoA hydratase